MVGLIYRRLLQIGKIASALTFLFGIPYGIWQYVEAQHDKKIEQSLKLFDKFNSPPFTDYRDKISKAAAKGRVQLNAAAATKDLKVYEAAVLEVVERNEIEAPLWLIMDFFDGVTICVVNGLCDPHTTSQLFTERARDVLLTFYQYIAANRKGPSSATFGYGLEFIATNGQNKAGR